MSSIRSVIKALAVFTSAVALTIGCSSGNTDGGTDDSGKGGGFVVTPTSVGTIDLSVSSTSLSVGDTASYAVRVRDASGNPVPNIRVTCDTEGGLALVEPTTGSELTSSSGTMTGVLGCEASGSLQIGCRLPVGADIRDFVTITCSGNIPAGFDGFAGAGGGGLGGGGGVGNDGSNNTGDVRITKITFEDGGDENTRNIDVIYNTNCDGNVATNDPETFSDTYIRVTIKNTSNSTYTFRNYSFVIPNDTGTTSNRCADDGDYCSPQVALTGDSFDVVPGSEATFLSVFAHQLNAGTVQNKSFVGSTSNITMQNVDVEITVSGSDNNGNEVSISGEVNLSFANFNRCS
jgi:hypothetical protein